MRCFTAGKVLDPFLLVRTTKIEASNIGAGRALVVSDLDELFTVGYLFPDAALAIQAVAALVYIGQFNGGADNDFTPVWLFFTR